MCARVKPREPKTPLLPLIFCARETTASRNSYVQTSTFRISNKFELLTKSNCQFLPLLGAVLILSLRTDSEVGFPLCELFSAGAIIHAVTIFGDRTLIRPWILFTNVVSSIRSLERVELKSLGRGSSPQVQFASSVLMFDAVRDWRVLKFAMVSYPRVYPIIIQTALPITNSPLETFRKATFFSPS